MPVCRGSGRGRRLEEGEKGQGEAGGSPGSCDPKDTLEGPVTTAWRELGEGRWTQESRQPQPRSSRRGLAALHRVRVCLCV